MAENHENEESRLVRDMENERFLKGLRPVRNVSKKPPRAVYSIRLSLDEAQQFEAAARARGLTMSEFLRAAGHASITADRETALGELRARIRELNEAVSRL
jgi:hypothetical protein